MSFTYNVSGMKGKICYRCSINRGIMSIYLPSVSPFVRLREMSY
jgi:hypothetical protein